MLRKFVKFVAILAALLAVAIASTGCFKFDDHKGFIRAEGRIMVDEDGKEYIIEAINFGNDAMSYITEANPNYGEETYAELAEMGLNSVRFLINYNLFEDDENPYVYKESGFEWLDTNIEYAKKHGLRLILDMHVPQGGYQSWDRDARRSADGYDEGDSLWVHEENQKRLAVLWKAIAERYADEPVILGYGVLNEPMVAVAGFAKSDDPAVKYEKAITLYQKVLDEITASIREVDNNHIIFIQRLYAIKNLNDDTEYWVTVNEDNNFFLVDDDNVVYEFHFYAPNKYTHQGGTGSTSTDYTYGDENGVIATNVTYKNLSVSPRASLNTDEWQFVQTGVLKFSNESWNVLGIGVNAASLGANGTAYFDNFVLKEYDENYEFVQDVYYEYFEWAEWEGFYMWDPNYTATLKVTDDVCYEGDECLSISGSLGEASVNKYAFKPTQGHYYQLTGYVKLENVERTANVTIRVMAGEAESVTYLTKDVVVDGIEAYIPFSEKYNVPIFCGEYGLTLRCFYKNEMRINRNGEQWVSDVIDTFQKNNIGSAYHMYSGGRGYWGGSSGNDFGMYQTYDKIQIDGDALNKTLKAILTEKFSDPTEE